MISLRGHYSIDIFGGIIMGHYIWLLAERYSFLIDVKVFRIPFHKRFPLFTKSCQNCQYPIDMWTDLQYEYHILHSHKKNDGDILNEKSDRESGLIIANK
jgi:hypothetical protein